MLANNARFDTGIRQDALKGELDLLGLLSIVRLFALEEGSRSKGSYSALASF